jgi:hypothetical protein
MPLEFSLLHQSSGLLARAAQDQSSAGAVDGVRKFLESLQARRVNRCHVSKPKDNDRRQLRDPGKDFVDFVSSAKEKRTMNAEDRYVERDFFVLQNVCVTFA